MKHTRIGLLMVLSAGAIAGMWVGWTGPVDPVVATAASPTGTAADVSRRTPIVEAFERNKDAVVSISSKYIQEVVVDDVFGWWLDGDYPFRRRKVEIPSLGSGFVINRNGYIVTNAHVVRRADEITVIMADNTKYPARKVAEDTRSDLALLKVDSDKPLPTVMLGRSDDLMIGETVLAIGNPFGYQHTLTDGILSAIHRDVEFSENMILAEMLQISAPINPGNSGGPLLNVRGEVIGINTAIRKAAQGIGFAIPIDQLREKLSQMINIERLRRIDFGLDIDEARNGSTIGIRVAAVRPDSAAAKAAFKPEDVIARVDGQPVRSAIDFYLNMLERKLNTTVHFEVQRRGLLGEKKQQIDLTLKERPRPNGKKMAQDLFGLELGYLTDAMIKRYQIAGEAGNIVVLKVEKGSPAYYARLEAGDVLMAWDGIIINDLDQLGYKLETVRNGDQLGVVYTRTENIGGYLILKQYNSTLRARSNGRKDDSAVRVFDL